MMMNPVQQAKIQIVEDVEGNGEVFWCIRWTHTLQHAMESRSPLQTIWNTELQEITFPVHQELIARVVYAYVQTQRPLNKVDVEEFANEIKAAVDKFVVSIGKPIRVRTRRSSARTGQQSGKDMPSARKSCCAFRLLYHCSYHWMCLAAYP